MAVLPKGRSALSAARQLPGEGPTLLHLNQNPMMMMSDDDAFFSSKISFLV